MATTTTGTTGTTAPGAATESFFALTPDRVLDAVEFGGRRATGYALALNSLENRVYEVELEGEDRDGARAERVVAKFYRPGRWSRAALLEEHAFLAELAEAELPVVPPLDLGGGETLGTLPVQAEGGEPIYYAVFPRARGRAPEELDDQQLGQLGRLVGRLHNIGARRPAPARPVLTPESYGQASIELLAQGPWIPGDMRDRYVAVAGALLARCEATWTTAGLGGAVGEPIRLHGDCHLGNLLWEPRTGPWFLDFDDFLSGPPVQDLWLLAPGHDAEADRQRELIAAGYETMRAFDRRSLGLVETLRALRILRYAAWIARRYEDPAFQRAFPDFTSGTFWHREIQALGEQLARLEPVLW
ncbi:MAG TPA: serine/threonine protein kinase [Polyangia bacterium]|nr:serine/threonine protein kinase [Polyangia bacterium]